MGPANIFPQPTYPSQRKNTLWLCRANKVQPQSTLPGPPQTTRGRRVLCCYLEVDVMPSSESFAIALYHNIEYFIPEMLLRFFVVPGAHCPNKCTSWRCSRRPQNKHHKAPASSWLQISWCWYLEMTPSDTPNGDPLCFVIKRVKWDEVRIHMQPG